MELAECLPAPLRDATITKIAQGQSGAGVYRVDAGERSYVLKLGSERNKVHVQQLAADAGVAPRIVHVDEARRAVLSERIEDRSFPMFYWTNRDAALALLGPLLRRVHELPAGEVPPADSRALLVTFASQLDGFPLPAFVRETIAAVLAEPRSPLPHVLCHNDVNPSNLVYDGERVLLLDWDVAAPNDPRIDLAAIAVFFRMDEATQRALCAAYGAAFDLARPMRLVGALCGAAFLGLARASGHAGASDAAPLALVDLYQRMRAGLDLSGAEGRWQFGLALLSTSIRGGSSV